MNLWKRSLASLAMLSLVAVSAYHQANAVEKKSAARPGSGDNDLISSDPGAATQKEHRLLKWSEVDPPDRGKNPEYFVRAVFLDLSDMPEGQRKKDTYMMKILPIEIVENEYRVITFDHFANGMEVPAFLPDSLKKQLKKGGVVEIHRFYTTKEAQVIGHAKMIDFTYNDQIVPYPAGPAAYIKKGGLDSEQYLNALKGMQAFGNNPKDGDLKKGLDALASSSPNPQVKDLAGQLLSSMFGAQASGQPLLAAAPAQEKGGKKKGK